MRTFNSSLKSFCYMTLLCIIVVGFMAIYGCGENDYEDPITLTTVRSFSSPGGDPTGLAFDGTHLWNADGWDEKIYKIDPSDGSVVSSFDSPGGSPTGLAFDGTHLWNAEGVNYDTKIYKIDTSDGSVVSSFDFRGVPIALGLAFDGRHLWSSNCTYRYTTIYEIRPSDGSRSPVVLNFDTCPTGLAYDGVHLWCCLGMTISMMKIERK